MEACFGRSRSTRMEELLLTSRILILDAMTDAARIMSNRVPSGESPLSSPSNAKDAGAGRTTRSRSLKAEGVAESLTSENRTRRFASATKVHEAQINRFAPELKYFVIPLLARWRRPDGGAAAWAAKEPMLTGPMLQTLGVLLECAGPASPDRDAAVCICLDVVEEFWAHREPYVRRCNLFLLSRILLVGAEDTVLLRESLLEQVEPALRREGDDICRKMLGGVVAWLSRSGFLPTG
eukprot:TRINITY_DN55188_c0_g1_i2.p1 TRINITY_DN55188_c0_g1~~TRINITY_DN55188_c0_g1_i2.p1  ORF type:complete len:253 (-),score=25.57 TRINITY_DN55188_c0_g1_i2:16-726(-)